MSDFRIVTQGGRPLPPRPENLHQAHQPWCVDCKRKLDRTVLDSNGRCAQCANAVLTRAQGEARRAARDAAAIEAELQLLAPPKPPAREPRPRPAPQPAPTPLVGRPPRSSRAAGQGSNQVTANKLRRLGVSPLEVKQWAVGQGLLAEVARGRVAGELVDAYATAHGRAVAS